MAEASPLITVRAMASDDNAIWDAFVEAAPGSLWRAARDGVRLLLVFHALRHAG